MELIDKDKVVAMIDSIYNETNHKPFTDEVIGEREACRKILDFINTLDVSLEEKATQLSQKYFQYKNIEAHKCKKACIEMVEWFKAQKG